MKETEKVQLTLNRASRIRTRAAIAGMLAVSLALIAFEPSSYAQSESVLYSFANDYGSDQPSAGLVVDNGILYGTTANLGSVFALSPPAASGDAWTEHTLHAFTYDGGIGPECRLLERANRTFYGTTVEGGTSDDGVIFKLTPPPSTGGTWTEKVLYAFAGGVDGAFPTAGLVGESTGVLYGATPYGGEAGCADNLGCGTVFALTPPTSSGGSWTESVLYSFTGGGDGANPYGGLLLSDGVLYGTTYYGGASNLGTVFELVPPASPGGAWSESVLYSFAGKEDGQYPNGDLIISGNTLYGTTPYGGGAGCVANPGCGTVFALTPPLSPGGAWTKSILYAFGAVPGDGEDPKSGLLLKNGKLYGTTSYGGAAQALGGTVFSLTPPSSPGPWIETILHSFAGYGRDGAGPVAGLAIAPNSSFYGTTVGAGGLNGGTVYEVTP